MFYSATRQGRNEWVRQPDACSWKLKSCESFKGHPHQRRNGIRPNIHFNSNSFPQFGTNANSSLVWMGLYAIPQNRNHHTPGTHIFPSGAQTEDLRGEKTTNDWIWQHNLQLRIDNRLRITIYPAGPNNTNELTRYKLISFHTQLHSFPDPKSSLSPWSFPAQERQCFEQKVFQPQQDLCRSHKCFSDGLPPPVWIGHLLWQPLIRTTHPIQLLWLVIDNPRTKSFLVCLQFQMENAADCRFYPVALNFVFFSVLLSHSAGCLSGNPTLRCQLEATLKRLQNSLLAVYGRLERVRKEKDLAAHILRDRSEVVVFCSVCG